MKVFWQVLGMKQKTYTGKAAQYVIDTKSGKRYEIGNGKWFKKEGYPKNLLEKSPRYVFHYAIPLSPQIPDRIAKKGLFGKKRNITTPFCAQTLEREHNHLPAFWEIEGLSLYTAKAADFIRGTATGKEYRRGEIKIFSRTEELPFPLAEQTEGYEFIYEENGDGASWTEKDELREIRGGLLGRILFGGK